MVRKEFIIGIAVAVTCLIVWGIVGSYSMNRFSSHSKLQEKQKEKRV